MGGSLAVAEFGLELQKRRRDFGELASFVDALGRLHDDLKGKVLHVFSTGLLYFQHFPRSKFCAS